MPSYPCPPPNPARCPQVCPPAPPPPPCRVKPVMRGLHMQQTKSKMTQAILLALTGGLSYYLFVGRVRKAKYAEYRRRAEIFDQADEMARKGLFQSVPAS